MSQASQDSPHPSFAILLGGGGGGGGGGGVLWISSDGDEQMTFLGFRSSILRLCWGKGNL